MSSSKKYQCQRQSELDALRNRALATAQAKQLKDAKLSLDMRAHRNYEQFLTVKHRQQALWAKDRRLEAKRNLETYRAKQIAISTKKSQTDHHMPGIHSTHSFNGSTSASTSTKPAVRVLERSLSPHREDEEDEAWIQSSVVVFEFHGSDGMPSFDLRESMYKSPVSTTSTEVTSLNSTSSPDVLFQFDCVSVENASRAMKIASTTPSGVNTVLLEGPDETTKGSEYCHKKTSKINSDIYRCHDDGLGGSKEDECKVCIIM